MKTVAEQITRGTDSACWHIFYDGTWHKWESLGGFFKSDLTICSWGNGRLDIFGVGQNSLTYHKWYWGGWSNWECLGGLIASAPAAVSWGPDRIDLFAIGCDQTLNQLWWDGKKW